MKTKILRNRTAGLEPVAQQIRPLPENVMPSARFQTQMKLRLLELRPAAKGRIEKRAA
jgi:hypothetical protein